MSELKTVIAGNPVEDTLLAIMDFPALPGDGPLTAEEIAEQSDDTHFVTVTLETDNGQKAFPERDIDNDFNNGHDGQREFRNRSLISVYGNPSRHQLLGEEVPYRIDTED